MTEFINNFADLIRENPNKAIALFAEAKAAADRLEKIYKPAFREIIGEDGGAISGNDFVVTVASPAAVSPSINTAAWKAAAPKEYADVLRRYAKPATIRAGQVRISKIKR